MKIKADPILLEFDEHTRNWKITFSLEVSEAAFLAACQEDLEEQGIHIANAGQATEVVDRQRDLSRWLMRRDLPGVRIEVVGGDDGQ